MGVDPPFIYDPPSRYSFSGPTEKGFNPKAATQASWSPPSPKPKPDGPLVSFNQHPDSYLLVPYGNLNATPMSPNTKNKVNYSRKVQLALRVLALLGALGILFCVIAIKGTSGSLGWIIRVAPAVALLHTVYAIYHLCRSSTGRTAGSSASYMVFAAMIDAGLLPFLAFSAFMAYNEHTTAAYGWETLFGVPLTTWYIVYSTFILCVVEGGLLLVSLVLGIYLAILFRKIAKLPPDMNPLEPNLTARPHKRNKSELTLSDKHMSRTSLVSEKRMSSTAEPLITPGRRVPFMHTRTDSASSSPRNSRMETSRPQSMYQQSNHSYRGSHVSIDKSLPSPPSRPQSAMAPSISSRNAGAGLDHRPARSSQLAQEGTGWPLVNPNRQDSPLETYHQRVTVPRHGQVQSINDENVPSISPVSSAPSTPDREREVEYVEIKNWYESPHKKDKKSQNYQPILQKESAQQQKYSPTRTQQARHDRRENLYDFDRDLHSPSPRSDKMSNAVKDSQNPLGMNPPSPEFSEHQTQTRRHSIPERRFESQSEEPTRYTLHDAPVNIPTPAQRPRIGGSRPLSFVGSGTKGKYYGNLRSPVGSVNGNLDQENEMQTPRADLEIKSDTASNYSRQQSTRTRTLDSHIDVYSDDATENGDLEKSYLDLLPLESTQQKELQPPQSRPYTYPSRYESPEPTANTEIDRAGRVVSATSADPHDLSSTYSYAGLGAEFGRGMGRRREVSGKIAEEGRAIRARDDGGMGYQNPYHIPLPARNEPSRNSSSSPPGPALDRQPEPDRESGMMLSPEARAMARMWDNANAAAELERERELEKEREREREEERKKMASTPKKNRFAAGLGAPGWARFKGL